MAGVPRTRYADASSAFTEAARRPAHPESDVGAGFNQPGAGSAKVESLIAATSLVRRVSTSAS